MFDGHLIKIRNVSFKRDRRFIFKGVNLTLGRGEALHLMGPNGCGKTTLIRVMTTLLNPSAGNIYYLDKDVNEVRYQYLSELLYIGHKPAVKLWLSVEENLAWMAASEGIRDRDLVLSALDSMGLAGFNARLCHQLSAGQIRRVALARLMLTKRKIWLLDEPFSTLDAEGTFFITNFLQEHLNREGAIFVTSHQDIELSSMRRYDLSQRCPRYASH